MEHLTMPECKEILQEYLGYLKKKKKKERRKRKWKEGRKKKTLEANLKEIPKFPKSQMQINRGSKKHKSNGF